MTRPTLLLTTTYYDFYLQASPSKKLKSSNQRALDRVEALDRIEACNKEVQRTELGHVLDVITSICSLGRVLDVITSICSLGRDASKGRGLHHVGATQPHQQHDPRHQPTN